ncbi:MAG TPA: hypothetical protein VMW27_02660 [Thermoanaerobaculia bacterium]|nr:hypothetical protein [Thermoanaerobaculia bacterium]
MFSRKTLFSLALVVLGLSPAAAQAAGQFFFIHVPPTSVNKDIGQVTKGLKEIGKSLEDNWKAGHPGKTPKVCWVGFAGPWSAGGSNPHNNAGDAANRIGNSSSTDNQEGYSMPIEYCVLGPILDSLLKDCDIVIAMGEGSENAFDLENHGDPTKPPIPDCGGNTPGTPVCTGDGCSGTDWSDPVDCETGGGCFIPSVAQWVICGYEAAHADDPPGSYIPVKHGTGAGNFLCGAACCIHRNE